MYQNFDTNGQKRRNWMPWALGITCILFLVSAGLAIYFAVSNNTTTSSSSSGECTTEACIDIADQILSSIDDSVDPCEDFFTYACGNWEDTNDWELVSNDAYSQFDVLSYYEMTQFLDGLYYDTNDSLVNHSSVLKAKYFYTSCYDSTTTEEDVSTSALFSEFINNVTFVDSSNSTSQSTWTQSNKEGFKSAISWLAVRGWNYLFQVSTLATGYPLLSQDYELWLTYNSTSYRQTINDTYVPLYQSYFGLSESEAIQMGKDVSDFADKVADITTAKIGAFTDATLQQYYLRATTLQNLTEMTGSDILNLTEILFETFDTKDITYVLYYSFDINYFNNLSLALQNDFTPNVIQYWIYTDVLINAFDFEESYEQSRSYNRVEFCYYQILEYFPFIYGYILDHVLYGSAKYDAIYDTVENIRVNGIRAVLQEATWLDDASLTTSLEKIDNLGIYVGLPPKIGNFTALDNYYALVSQSNNDFVSNLGELINFAVYQTRATFLGTMVDLISPWPSIFDDSSSYDSWLTGINAFYVPSGNFFTIPITISQVPFYNKDYPSSINYGGLGGVIGHEISHGFDPDGSYYNYNGSYGDIWTNYTRAAYGEVEECFVTQYDGLEIEPGVYVNGTRTITENVADNGGVTASHKAWKTYISENGDDQSLPGVDLSSDQLFWWSWAHAWCEAYKSSYYVGWTDVHSPNPARVWGVVQNSDDFASAYGCASGSAMNPSSKCVLW